MTSAVVASVSPQNDFWINKQSFLEKIERCNKKYSGKHTHYVMIKNNEITEEQFISGTGSLKQTYLTYDDVVAAVIVFGAVAATMDIVWQHLVPLKF